MHPFLDTTKFSDDELIEKLGKAYMFMNAQVALGHNPTVVSIKEVIEALEEERQTRMHKIMQEEHKKKNPDTNQPFELGKLED